MPVPKHERLSYKDKLTWFSWEICRQILRNSNWISIFYFEQLKYENVVCCVPNGHVRIVRRWKTRLSGLELHNKFFLNIFWSAIPRTKYLSPTVPFRISTWKTGAGGEESPSSPTLSITTRTSIEKGCFKVAPWYSISSSDSSSCG
jgi:hypothetical protein